MKLEVGNKVRVNHPVTCLNPEKYFTVSEIRIDSIGDNGRFFVRGVDTCWFSNNMILEIFGEFDYSWSKEDF